MHSRIANSRQTAGMQPQAAHVAALAAALAVPVLVSHSFFLPTRDVQPLLVCASRTHAAVCAPPHSIASAPTRKRLEVTAAVGWSVGRSAGAILPTAATATRFVARQTPRYSSKTYAARICDTKY